MIASMNSLLDDKHVQRIGCGALANLARQSELVARKLISAGAIEVSVRSMRMHECLEIHISGCMLFGALSELGEAAMNCAFEAQAVPCLIRAFGLHPEDEVLQSSACGALASLAILPACAEQIVELDGVRHILRALVRFPSSVGGLGGDGCLLLKRLCHVSISRPELASLCNAAGAAHGLDHSTRAFLGMS